MKVRRILGCLGLILGTVSSTAAEPARFHRALSQVRMLTQNPGGYSPWDNAECYFSATGDRLVFQGSRDGRDCDAIYTMDLDGRDIRMVSTGTGRTTCAFFTPNGREIVYASTHLDDAACPTPPDMSQGYTWAVFDGYDIFKVAADGGQPVRLTHTDGYDAEAVVHPDGDRILFTSDRDGDLEIYDMAMDGSNVRRLTRTPGYDGGAFYTADGASIVFRGRHPEGEELAEYQRLLAQGLIRPGQLDLYVMDADGGNLRRITTTGDDGATNWAPYPHPDGRHIVFASNRDDFNQTIPGRYGFNFELYIIGMDGTGLTRLTWNPSFDGFPMFSSDGTKLVWCGNYVPGRSRDTDVMLADWVDSALP